jgi:hypothetical protein
MLLHVDGLDIAWDGVSMPRSEYDGALGDLEYDDAPLSIQRLLSPDEIREYDISSRPTRPSNYLDSHEYNEVDNDERVRIVRKLSLNFFCQKLVEHFDILFKDKK